eukprot:1158955-Pelagomonas_calceolata.AAC.16
MDYVDELEYHIIHDHPGPYLNRPYADTMDYVDELEYHIIHDQSGPYLNRPYADTAILHDAKCSLAVHLLQLLLEVAHACLPDSNKKECYARSLRGCAQAAQGVFGSHHREETHKQHKECLIQIIERCCTSRTRVFNSSSWVSNLLAPGFLQTVSQANKELLLQTCCHFSNILPKCYNLLLLDGSG